MLSSNVRLCGICQMSGSFVRADDGWVRSPCRCAVWFHTSCLINAICQLEVDNPARLARCLMCYSIYNIFPRKEGYVLLVEGFSYILYEEFCVLIDQVCNIVVIETLYGLFGMVTLFQVCGRQYTMQMLMAVNPFIAWGVCCYLIPWTLILICYVPWDDTFLQILRKASGVPIIGRIMPQHEPSIQVALETPPFYMTLVSAILLPSYSLATSRLLFPGENNIRSTLISGAVFICLTGLFRMYYKQKLYSRMSSLSVLDYDHHQRI